MTKFKIFKALSLSVLLSVMQWTVYAQGANEHQTPAALYAADNNVTIEEAQYRISIQSEIGDLNEILLLDSRIDFAGIYIQHQPNYRIHVLFKNQRGSGNHTNTGEIQRRLARTSWRSFVKIRKVNKSLEELRTELRIASDIAGQLNISASLSVDVSKNQTKIYVTDQNEFEIALLDAELTLPEDVVLIELDHLAEPESKLQPGAKLSAQDNSSGCTAGFLVKNADGDLGVLTAGHCDDDLKFGSTFIEFEDEEYGGSYDVQWHKFRTEIIQSDTDVICDSFFGFCGAETITGTAQTVMNAHVCKYGAVTGYECSYVESLVHEPKDRVENGITYKFTDSFVSVKGHITAKGDSGGPWYQDGKALGVHSEGQDATGDREALSVYMPIKNISILGLSVFTQ